MQICAPYILVIVLFACFLETKSTNRNVIVIWWTRPPASGHSHDTFCVGVSARRKYIIILYARSSWGYYSDKLVTHAQLPTKLVCAHTLADDAAANAVTNETVNLSICTDTNETAAKKKKKTRS